ncbi:MAG TPA: hypothetical protein VFU15_03345 [Bacteroidia bacterium]|nr:hypothetical protein [Bacteroidia bacterium]
MKKWMSWIWPRVIKRTRGKISPVLEVSWENGRKVLNARYVNYSYGSLHDVFRIALRNVVDLSDPPRNVLILGFGVGSIASILTEEMKISCTLTGVEADEEVIRLGKEEFDTGRFSGLRIVHLRAENFVRQCSEEFDLIAIDVFVEDKVPRSLMNEEFLLRVEKLLSAKGRVVMNIMENDSSGGGGFRRLFQSVFSSPQANDLDMGVSVNRLLTGSKKKKSIS